MLKIEFGTDGAAFRDPETGEENVIHENDECARILNRIVESLRNGGRSGIIMDLNGNKVGRWTLQ